MTSFVIGMTGVIFYIDLKVFSKKSVYQTDNSVVEAVVSEYTSRLEEFGRVIGELKVKIDTVELRLLQRPTLQTSDAIDMTLGTSEDVRTKSQSKSQLQEHQSSTSDVMVSTKSQLQEHQSSTITLPTVATTEKSNPNMHHSTSDYILKLLVEKSRTSREIQSAIGRTREHTSRLMRKLYESNLVSRENNNKPFKYNITDEGRRELIFHNKTGEAAVSEMDVLSGSQDYQLKATVR
ncbi:MAG: helix-turn-helix domain-containing protein [Candidatus Nitrosopolaris sp.]